MQYWYEIDYHDGQKPVQVKMANESAKFFRQYIKEKKLNVTITKKGKG